MVYPKQKRIDATWKIARFVLAESWSSYEGSCICKADL
jgi:hypothetical protein